MSNREAITAEYTRKLHDEITDLTQKLDERTDQLRKEWLSTIDWAGKHLEASQFIVELQTRVEFLELEREEWRDDKRAGFDRVFEAMNDDPNNPYDRKWSTICLHIESTQQDLIESQAREARLREFSLDQWWYSELKSLLDFDGITDDAKRAIIGVIPNLIGQIQALPQDDTALKEYRNQVIEECAVICDGDSNYDDMTGSDCAAAIRALNPTTR